jgi:hypothetical protein
MSNTKTGGPAFPLSNDQVVANFPLNQCYGMTLRDYFASKVLQGLLASGLDQPKFEFARKSYEMADEMLKVREA